MDTTSFDRLPPTDRLTIWRSQQPPIEKPRRPVRRELTPAELAALQAEHLPYVDYVTKARALQHQPAPEPASP
jgi:hypothetical protein